MVLTAIEFHYLAKELQTLIGSTLKNIRRGESLSFELKTHNRKNLILIVGKDYCFLTERLCEDEPDGFCNFLLNKIGKERIQAISQNDFNKVLIVSFTGFRLVIEFIGKGNIILCDENYTIITSLIQREFKDRKILIGEKYVFPASPDIEKYEGVKDEKTLVSELHISRIYAQEIIQKNLSVRKLLERKLSPGIYFQKDGERIIAPFEVETLNLKFEKKESLSQAIEEIYSVKKETKEEIIKRGQEKNAKKYEREAKEFEEKAKILMGILTEVETAVNAWKKEKKIIEPAKSANEKKGTITISIDEREVEIPLTKEPRKIIDEYFSKAKKSRSKIGKTRDWMEKTVPPKKLLQKSHKKEEWFDQFRNFVTTDGFLVILGKDATTNEKIIKKYTKKEDIVLHAHIPGSPFAVVRSEGRKVSEAATKEAAQFTASYSRFWISRLGIADIYWITPEQVSKSAIPGEHIAKGSFMIYGKRNFLRVDLRIAIGVNEKFEVIRGVKSSMEKRAKYFIEVVPGSKEGRGFAEEIKALLMEKAKGDDKESIKQINPEEFLKFVPYGKGELAK